MRGALIFLCLTLWATATARPQTEDDAHYEGQKARLGYLKEKLEEMEHEVESRIKVADDIEHQMTLVERAIKDAEPTGCNDRFEFQCGGHHPKCISRLLVCDGVNDCENGHDESEECIVYTPAGSVWEGRMEVDTCTKRQPKDIRLTIEVYRIYDYLRSFPHVEATLDFNVHQPDFDHASSLAIEGHMDLMHGNHILYFDAPENDGLAIQCVFHSGGDNHCHGSVLYESTHQPCAHFILQRKDVLHEAHEEA